LGKKPTTTGNKKLYNKTSRKQEYVWGGKEKKQTDCIQTAKGEYAFRGLRVQKDLRNNRSKKF